MTSQLEHYKATLQLLEEAKEHMIELQDSDDRYLMLANQIDDILAEIQQITDELEEE